MPSRRKRLPRQDRERLILEEAARFFSEVGFDGSTRLLAERLGFTQPLLYSYFPDKEHLLERVLEDVFNRQWRSEWAALLTDRQRLLIERLIDFYKHYWHEALTKDYLRVLTYAALKQGPLPARHFENIRQNVLLTICRELRHELGLPDEVDLPIDDAEVEAMVMMHSAVASIALRPWVYSLPIPADVDLLIEQTVRGCWPNCRDTFLRLVGDRLASGL